MRAASDRYSKGEEVAPYEYALLTKGGKRIEAIIATKLISYEGERTILGIVTDITERKQALQALRESEEKYRDLVENIDDVIYSVDAEGVLSYVSPAIESLIGIPASEVVGRHFAEFIHPEDLTQA